MPLFAEKHTYRCNPLVTMAECQQIVIEVLQLSPHNYHLEGDDFHFAMTYRKMVVLTDWEKMHVRVTGKITSKDNQPTLYWQIENIQENRYKHFLAFLAVICILAFISASVFVLYSFAILLIFTPFLLLYFLGYRLVGLMDFYDKEDFVLMEFVRRLLHMQHELVEKIPVL